MRSCEPHVLGDILFVKCERLLEHASELSDLPLERLLIGPRQTGVQQFPRDTLDSGGYRQTEGAKALEVGLGELTRVDGIDDSARVLEWATLSCAELPAGPASVDEPAVDVVFRHALGKHLGVAARVEDDERRAVASRESRNRL